MSVELEIVIYGLVGILALFSLTTAFNLWHQTRQQVKRTEKEFQAWRLQPYAQWSDSQVLNKVADQDITPVEAAEILQENACWRSRMLSK